MPSVTSSWTVLPLVSLASFSLLLAAPGCDGTPVATPTNLSDDGVSSQTGLAALNGLAAVSGRAAINVLKRTSSVISTADGRTTMSYLVRCALPQGRSVTLKDQNGTGYTFGGQIGLTPQWETGTCDSNCQEQISACLMAHVNTTGQHIALWLVGDNSALGWGLSSSYPYQEGSFFGNIFSSPPQAYYCDGEDYDLAVVPGRLGANQTGAPYTDPFGSTAACKKYCTASPSPYGTSGYSQCKTFKHVVTVYRDWDPNTPYKICSRSTGACMTAPTASGGKITLATATGALNQQFYVSRVNPGQYRVCSAQNGLCLVPAAGTAAPLQQTAYTGAASQLWNVTPHDGAYGYYFACSLQSTLCAAVTGSAPGAIENDSFHNISAQQWSITPLR